MKDMNEKSFYSEDNSSKFYTQMAHENIEKIFINWNGPAIDDLYSPICSLILCVLETGNTSILQNLYSRDY